MSLTAELYDEIALLQSALAGFMDAQIKTPAATMIERALGRRRSRRCFRWTIFI